MERRLAEGCKKVRPFANDGGELPTRSTGVRRFPHGGWQA
jgi:hypothetical protein